MVFYTKYGYFEYKVMLLSLFNVFANFQGYINKILAKKLNIFVMIYLDDILIYTKNPNLLYVDVIQWILEQLRKYDLYANLKKRQFYKNEV